MIPVVLFARVSSPGQDNNRQLAELATVAQRNGWNVVDTIRTTISGTRKKRVDREDLDKLMSLARTGKIKKILISEVSRLGRRPGETYTLLEELTELKVSIYAHNYGLETLLPNGQRNPAAILIFVIFSEQARSEIELLSQRVRSGQAEAKANGKHIARPKGSFKSKQKLLFDYPKVVKYLKAGNCTIREIALLSGVSPGTVMKLKRLINPVV